MAKLKYIILGGIAIIHLLVLGFMVMTPDKEKQPAAGKTATEAVAPAVPLSPPEPAGSLFTPYAPDYFTVSSRPLPKTIEKRTGEISAGAVVDLTSRTVYWGKHLLQAYPMASMTKMMTALLVVETLHESEGRLSLETPVRVTVAASKIGGRQVWLDPRESLTIDELLKCVLIRSANDCAYLLGEFLGGSESVFVARMNERAKELGCRQFIFYNTHGLPDNGRENLGSPAELAFLAGVLMDIPEIVRWTTVRRDAIREDRKIFYLDTTNSLLGRCPGVNGMKTGMTNKAGHCITVTCERDGRRLVVVVMGAANGKSRDALARDLLEWGYAQQ
ncbi:MAG: D-alanyl-D-alanine carboxypeptidase family protein [Lentisphaeria bacterium]